MSRRITQQSISACLDEQGARCPVEGCNSSNIRVTAELGDSDEPTKEHFVCTSCDTEWTAYLFAVQIESIMDGQTGRRHEHGFGDEDLSIEKGVFDMVPCPSKVVADALKDFLRSMTMGTVQSRGEALAKLAFIARVELSSLPGSRPEELPKPPFETT